MLENTLPLWTIYLSTDYQLFFSKLCLCSSLERKELNIPFNFCKFGNWSNRQPQLSSFIDQSKVAWGLWWIVTLLFPTPRVTFLTPSPWHRIVSLRTKITLWILSQVPPSAANSLWNTCQCTFPPLWICTAAALWTQSSEGTHNYCYCALFKEYWNTWDNIKKWLRSDI